ncbi:unnamed protein product [Enterobius vermicularis]|uniref:Clathrin_bdg domain-containing protein n=1 Tax=Enterobius vermicularis TaxID=51028 RepID=A0A0N4UWS9_ENTVE|nr:unnamed protein product [Enterobius vermicularis]
MDKYEDDERSEQSDREDSDSSFGDSDDRPDSETGTAKDFAEMTTDSESFDQHFDDEKFLQEEETNNDLLDLTIDTSASLKAEKNFELESHSNEILVYDSADEHREDMELLDPTHIEQFHTVIPLEKQRDNDDLLDEEYIEQRSTEKDLEEEEPPAEEALLEDLLSNSHSVISLATQEDADDILDQTSVGWEHTQSALHNFSLKEQFDTAISVRRQSSEEEIMPIRATQHDSIRPTQKKAKYFPHFEVNTAEIPKAFFFSTVPLDADVLMVKQKQKKSCLKHEHLEETYSTETVKKKKPVMQGISQIPIFSTVVPAVKQRDKDILAKKKHINDTCSSENALPSTLLPVDRSKKLRRSVEDEPTMKVKSSSKNLLLQGISQIHSFTAAVSFIRHRNKDNSSKQKHCKETDLTKAVKDKAKQKNKDEYLNQETSTDDESAMASQKKNLLLSTKMSKREPKPIKASAENNNDAEAEATVGTGDLFISLVKKVPEPGHFSEENLSENDDNDNHKELLFDKAATVKLTDAVEPSTSEKAGNGLLNPLLVADLHLSSVKVQPNGLHHTWVEDLISVGVANTNKNSTEDKPLNELYEIQQIVTPKRFVANAADLFPETRPRVNVSSLFSFFF